MVFERSWNADEKREDELLSALDESISSIPARAMLTQTIN
jgi:hypothetical protein